jgi:glycosyltransferase involved in cell wall biosynthesis
MNNHLPTILLITNWAGVGGAEQQFRLLVKGIDKERFRVIAVTLYPGPFDKEMSEIPGIEYICLKRKGKYNFLPMLNILKILRQKRVDVVQPFLTPSTLYGLMPALLARTRVKVVTERCGLRTEQRLGYKILCFTEDVLGHSAQIAVANSIAGQQMLVERGYKPEKTSVIYNGLDLGRLKADPTRVAQIQVETGLASGGPIIGITAWVIPAKDHATFIKSAAIILKQKPGVRFAILGDGELVPDLKTLTCELNISKQVFFLGAQKDVGNYLHLFDILVSSSVDHEGCSNSLIEAMALSKPVVATDVGGNREVVIPGENGILVAPKDPEAMAKAILSLLDDPEQARSMGEKGRAMANSIFDQSSMVRQYQDLWLNLLGRKTPDKDRTIPSN